MVVSGGGGGEETSTTQSSAAMIEPAVSNSSCKKQVGREGGKTTPCFWQHPMYGMDEHAIHPTKTYHVPQVDNNIANVTPQVKCADTQ